MVLNDSPLKIPLAGVIFLTAIVGFGYGQTLVENVAKAAHLMLPLALATAFMMSKRSMGEMSNAETFAFFAPSVVVLAYNYSSDFENFTSGFEPYFSGLMLILVGFSYWALTNENV